MNSDCKYIPKVFGRDICIMPRDECCQHRPVEGVMYDQKFYTFCNLNNADNNDFTQLKGDKDE